jgi:hypothetical protein
MPDIVADPPDPPCFRLNSEYRIQEFQPLGPDPSPPRARGDLMPSWLVIRIRSGMMRPQSAAE